MSIERDITLLMEDEIFKPIGSKTYDVQKELEKDIQSKENGEAEDYQRQARQEYLMNQGQKVHKAADNRLKCTLCGYGISKGDMYYRDAVAKFRASHTVNIHLDHFNDEVKKELLAGAENDRV